MIKIIVFSFFYVVPLHCKLVVFVLSFTMHQFIRAKPKPLQKAKK